MRGQQIYIPYSEPRATIDGLMTANTNVIRSNTINFNTLDVGTICMVRGAGEWGDSLISTVTRVLSSTQAELEHFAVFTVVGAELVVGGRDETEPLQEGINQLINQGGGTLLLPTARIWAEKDNFINPKDQIPVTIKGTGINIRDTGRGSRMFGTVILRSKAGAVFNVNLDEYGNSGLGDTDQYTCFGLEGISFVGKADSPGMSAIKMHRTRANVQNCFMSRMDYLVLQPEKNAAGKDSYCDQSHFTNLRISESLLGGLKLYKSDASTVVGLRYEQPVSGRAKHAIEVHKTRSISINGLVYWSGPDKYTSIVPESSFIKCTDSLSIGIENAHIERMSFEKGIVIKNCKVANVELLDSSYDSNTMISVQNSDHVKVEGWDSNEDKRPGQVDIELIGDCYNFKYDRLSFKDKAGIPRTHMIAGLKSTAKPIKFVFSNSTLLPKITNLNADVFLYEILSDRTLEFPDPILHPGGRLTIVNRNENPFYYKPNYPIKDADGTDVPLLPNNVTITLTAIDKYYRIITAYKSLKQL